MLASATRNLPLFVAGFMRESLTAQLFGGNEKPALRLPPLWTND